MRRRFPSKAPIGNMALSRRLYRHHRIKRRTNDRELKSTIVRRPGGAMTVLSDFGQEINAILGGLHHRYA